MQKLTLIFCVFWFFGCTTNDIIVVNPPAPPAESKIEALNAKLDNSDGDDVMVIAHRGVYKNAPENSIGSIEAAIALGVDMVEIDIRKTLDGVLILMHDETINRMTNGTGRVDQLTLAEIKEFNLRNMGGGVLTNEKVPTLEEAMLAAKGKILMRIDKAHEIGVLDEVVEILEKTETVDHANILVLRRFQPGSISFNWGHVLEKVRFTPGVNGDGSTGPQQVVGWLAHDKVVALETSFSDEEALTVNWNEIRKQGARALVYTGNPGSSGGRGDQRSIANIDEGYGWLISRGVNMIQTSESEFLLNYLRLRGLHE